MDTTVLYKHPLLKKKLKSPYSFLQSSQEEQVFTLDALQIS